MQGPAPVSLEAAGDGGRWRLAMLGLHLLAAGALLAWQPGPVMLMLAALLALSGLLAWRADARRAAPSLRWDGQTWWLGAQAVQPRVALDLGAWLLLRLRPPGRVLATAWLPLSARCARAAGASWPALRAALVATAGRPASGEGVPTP